MPAQHFVGGRIEIAITHPAAFRPRCTRGVCGGIAKFWHHTVEKARALAQCARARGLRQRPRAQQVDARAGDADIKQTAFFLNGLIITAIILGFNRLINGQKLFGQSYQKDRVPLQALRRVQR